MWGRIQDRAPVCLCIYEARGGRARKGGQPPAAVAGHVEPRSGQAACPFPWAGLMEPEFQVRPQTARPRPPGSRGHSLPGAHLPSLPREWGGGVASCPSPLALGSFPPLTGPSGHWGGWGWWWGEALKAGDCLGELRDRAPIVPAPEPPQWSSRAQRGFDNGQDISMQGQPLGPLPVPQPRGGGGGALLPASWVEAGDGAGLRL